MLVRESRMGSSLGFTLRPLEAADFPAAAALLVEGFPERSRTFWDEGLRALKRYGGNAECGVPFGQLLIAEGRPAGIALTPACWRRRGDGRRYPLVNFSSWYIRPEHRWLAGLMLRRLFSDPHATYVDLTPDARVARMLVVCGFRAVNTGTIVAALPLCAAGSGRGARVRDLWPEDELSAAAPPRPMLLAHRELGCRPLVIEHEAGRALIVYRERPVRGLPGARLMYVDSHAVLGRCLPALARFLLRRGLLMLSWDARGRKPSGLGSVHRAGGIWYALGEIDGDRTDFIGTELCILGV